MVPRVHLNGTSKEELFNQLKDAIRALRIAEIALGEATPNARDYYVISSSAATAAREQHMARLRKLDEIRKEIEAIAEGVLDQVDCRRHRQ
jgi:hypothetical protein